MRQLNLYIDVQNGQLVGGYLNSNPAQLPAVYVGDTLSLLLRFLQPTGNATSPYTDVDYSGGALKLGIGLVGRPPTGGTFFLTDPDSATNTGPIAYNAPAADVQAAVRTLANWSAATVTGPVAGPWTITNGTNAVRATLQGGPGLLQPKSQIIVEPIQAGDGAANPAVQQVELLQQAIAYQGTWTPSTPVGITVVRTVTGAPADPGPAANEVQTITVEGNPTSGSFVLSINLGGLGTVTVPYNASPSALQTLLQASAAFAGPNCTVTGSVGNYTVTFIGDLAAQAMPDIFHADATNLSAPLTVSGILSLNKGSVFAALGNAASISDILEISYTPSGGQPGTLLQAPITILNKLLWSTPDLEEGETYLTKAESDAVYPRMLPGITALSGGVAGDLDAIPTVSGQYPLNAPTLMAGIAGVNGGGFTCWQLQAGTDASDATHQRPADYNASTNAVVWVKLL